MIMSEYTVEVTCGSGNDYDGRIGVRISSIFVIGFGSMMGMFLLIAMPEFSFLKDPFN